MKLLIYIQPTQLLGAQIGKFRYFITNWNGSELNAPFNIIIVIFLLSWVYCPSCTGNSWLLWECSKI